jgi:hypothetical protein
MLLPPSWYSSAQRYDCPLAAFTALDEVEVITLCLLGQLPVLELFVVVWAVAVAARPRLASAAKAATVRADRGFMCANVPHAPQLLSRGSPTVQGTA